MRGAQWCTRCSGEGVGEHAAFWLHVALLSSALSRGAFSNLTGIVLPTRLDFRSVPERSGTERSVPFRSSYPRIPTPFFSIVTLLPHSVPFRGQDEHACVIPVIPGSSVHDQYSAHSFTYLLIYMPMCMRICVCSSPCLYAYAHICTLICTLICHLHAYPYESFIGYDSHMS